MIKGVIFDLDGVICDTAEYHYLAWKELGNELGISFSREFNENLKGISRTESLERILEFGGKLDYYSSQEIEELATKKNKNYVKLIENVSSDDLLPGIHGFLRSLKENKIKVALASASKNAPFLLEKMNVANFFDTIVDPATLQNGKPDPEIFIKGAKQLELSAHECLGIEDAYSGVEAINQAGMFSVGIGEQKTLSQADIVYSTTAELNWKQLLELALANQA